MYVKLAFRNVKRSFQDYAIYFLTLMFGVCIFYVFNSIDAQQTMMELSQTQHVMIETVNRAMSYTSVFISVILGFLIVYASRFLIKRRKKELGIYQVLGMKKGQIAFIINIETFFVATISLVVGLVVGIFLSQGFAVVTASLFEVKLVGFYFVFSSKAALKTVFYFGITFMLVMFLSTIEIGRQKLIELLYAQNKNEKIKMPNMFVSIVLFIISIILIGVAYKKISEDGVFLIAKTLLTCIIIGSLGTLLFFMSLSGFLLKAVQQHKTHYLKELNMFVLRQLNTKIATTFISISMVCLMLFLCITALSSCIGLSKAWTARLEEQTPYDATFNISAYKEIFDEEGMNTTIKWYDFNLKDYIDKTSIPYSDYAKEYTYVKYYDSGIEIPYVLNEKENDRGSHKITLQLDFIKLSDFNKLLSMQGKEEVILKENEFIINNSVDYLNDVYLEYALNNSIEAFGTTLTFSGMTEYIVNNSTSNASKGKIIVNDETIPDDTPVTTNIFVVNYIKSNQECEELFITVREEAMKSITRYNDTDASANYKKSAHLGGTKRFIFDNVKSNSVMVAYIGVYVGIVFLIISSAILAITQLSETTDNKNRYLLLQKLGADEKMINKALFSQIGIFFMAPLILAIIHSCVGIARINKTFESVVKLNVIKDSFFVVIVLVIIYGGYFMTTYFNSKRIVMNQ